MYRNGHYVVVVHYVVTSVRYKPQVREIYIKNVDSDIDVFENLPLNSEFSGKVKFRKPGIPRITQKCTVCFFRKFTIFL
jgi:hypothetical protein